VSGHPHKEGGGRKERGWRDGKGKGKGREGILGGLTHA